MNNSNVSHKNYQVEDSIFIGLDEAVQRSRVANQISLFNNANPPALPAMGNLTGRGGLFSNYSHGDYLVGFSMPSEASIFTNSITNTQHGGLARRIGGPTLPNREFFPKKDTQWVIGAKRIKNPETYPNEDEPSQTASSSIFSSNPSFSASNNSVQAMNSRMSAPIGNTKKPQIQAPPQNESTHEKEEKESEQEDEEEISENEQDSTTFAEDLQDLMANHQITAPENLFSNEIFTQNLVRFLRSYQIKASR